MKKIRFPNLLLLSFVLCAIHIQAQEAVKVEQTTSKINDYNGTALMVNFNRAEDKDILKEWKKTMKKYKSSVSSNGNEIIATEVSITSISEFPIRVFAKVEKNKENKQSFYVIFINGGQSISSSNDASGFTAAKKIVEDFANEVSKKAASDYQKVQEGLLKDMNKELKDNKKSTLDAQKTIEDSKNEITKMENLIKENAKKKSSLLEKIKQQKIAVENAKKAVGLYN